MNKENLLTQKLQKDWDNLYESLEKVDMAITKMKDDYISFFYKEIKVKKGEDFYFISSKNNKVKITNENLDIHTSFSTEKFLKDLEEYNNVNMFYLKCHYIDNKGKKSKEPILVLINLCIENWRNNFSKI